ncbi:MAG: hypothetical protein ACYC7G_04930 [Rudaea sp.]
MRMIRFEPFDLFWRPASALAWILTIAAIAYCVQVFAAIDTRSHSVTDTLYAVYPHWGVTFLLWEWLARRSVVRRSA